MSRLDLKWLYILPFLLTSSANHIKPHLLYNHGRSNDIYYRRCAPRVTCHPDSKYRTIEGSCNNLANPLWGSSMTPFLRLADAEFSDGDHEIRTQSDGSELPGPRDLHLALFWNTHRDFPANFNYHFSQFGQWAVLDISLTPSISDGPENCCKIPLDNKYNIPYQCRLVILPPHGDPVYGKTGQRCIEFRRAMTAAFNFNCPITPQIPMNQASPIIDASQVYGPTSDKAAELRTFSDGRLKTEHINGQEFCPLMKRSQSLKCAGRDNVDICFEAGDPRVNQHFGLTMYQTMFTRFHNFLAAQFQHLNPHWSDEELYQEARRFIGAINQIMVYRDYLPMLLGKSFADSFGLAIHTSERTNYNTSIIPQSTVEFSGSAYRVQHNIAPTKYNFVDKHYDLERQVNLNEHMSKPDELVKDTNFDDILRGMGHTPGRAPRPSYNFPVSNFMFHFAINGDQDLLSIDIQRGRDLGVPNYNTMRQKCGFPKASYFEDLSDTLSGSDINKLKKLYETVDDIDLLVGALLEPPANDAMVGPTARCIITDVFYRLRYGDRFFFDVENQPGSFSLGQLNAIIKIDLGHVFCATSGIDEVPVDIYKPESKDMKDCHSHLSKLDLSAWKEYPSRSSGF